MKKNLYILKKIPLFDKINNDDLLHVLECLNAKTMTFNKNDIILNQGDTAKHIGIILNGKIKIINDDFYGNRNILTSLESGEIFAEAFAFAENIKMSVSVICESDSEILFIDYKKIVNSCHKCCSCHNTIIFNLLRILSNKNITLNQKIEFISKRTTKEKILTYLNFEAKKNNSNIFDIPFNRQELADYLCIDRSAMSRQLSKLKEHGYLDFDKNHFKLL